MALGDGLGRLSAALHLDTAPLASGVARAKGEFSGLDSHAGASVGKIGSAFKGLGAVIAGAGAALAVGSFFKGAFKEADEARRTLAQTEAVLKSTGGAAHVTAEGVNNLSNKLSLLTGIDDEQIAANENLLLTFTNVRNEAGKGNDIFDQATGAINDMAVAMNGGSAEGADFKATAIQIGKALQDPINGVTSLQRVGVRLSDQQKQQVKDMVAVGDTMGAQKIILRELSTEFGGSAAATASPLAKLSVAFKNIEETVGTAFMPAIQSAATVLAQVLPDAMASVMAWFDRLKPAIRGVFDLFVNGDFTTAFGKAFHVDEDSAVVGMLFDIRDAAIGLAGVIKDHLAVSLSVVAGLFLAFSGPVVLTVAAIAALALGATYLYERFAVVRRVVGAVVEWFRTAVPAAFNVVRAAFTAAAAWVEANRATFEQWGAKIAAVFVKVGGVIAAAWDVIKAVVTQGVVIVSQLWDRFGQQLWEHIQTAFNAIVQVVSGALTFLQGILDVFAGIFTGDWARVWTGIREIFSGIWNVILGLLKGFLNQISTVIGAAMAIVTELWSFAWHFIATTVSNIFGGMVSTIAGGISDAVGWIAGLPGRAGQAISGLAGAIVGRAADAVGSMARAIRGGVDDAMSFVQSLPGRAANAIGDLSGFLFNAGANLIWGFIRGIESVFDTVRSTLGRLTSWLPSWKGPPGVDAMLLHNSGKLVISGFVKGIQDSFGDVKSTLGDLSSMVSGASGGSMTATVHAGLQAGEVALSRSQGTPSSSGAAPTGAATQSAHGGSTTNYAPTFVIPAAADKGWVSVAMREADWHYATHR